MDRDEIAQYVELNNIVVTHSLIKACEKRNAVTVEQLRKTYKRHYLDSIADKMSKKCREFYYSV